MNVAKLEAFLKEVGFKQDGDQLSIDYNEFKCGYCTAEKDEEHSSVLHKEQPRHWVSPEQFAAAMLENEVWQISRWMGMRSNKYTSARACTPSAALQAFGAIDQEITDQINYIKSLFDKVMVGEYSHASLGFETGQWFSQQIDKKGAWVDQLASVKEKMTEEDGDDQTNDWTSDESRDKAYEQNLVWYVHWYPHTPIGFYRVHAVTLQELVDYLIADIAGDGHVMV